ncbi:MAG TPA: carboxypeptidase regulatory-like domain-containing protein [Longimicrobiales bacterium]
MRRSRPAAATRPRSPARRPRAGAAARSVLAGSALLLLAVAPLAAQTVRGRLVAAGSRAPIGAAMVWLLDEADARLGGALTDSDGWFVLHAPAPGRYRLRAERVGFAATTSPELTLAAGAAITYELVASAEPIRLDGIEVAAEERCVVRPEAGLAAARLWEEARKALAAAAWAEDEGVYRFDVLSYERDLDPVTRAVRSEQRSARSVATRNPIRSRPAEELAAEGYIRRRADGDWDVFAPDAEVLLSDAFLDGHCFRAVAGEGENAALTGLAFEPVRGADLPDVSGVLWLDRSTGALRHLELEYEHVPVALIGREPWGRVEFEQLPNGQWFVRRWWIRSPIVAIQTGGPITLGTRRMRTIGILEFGGEVVGAESAHGRQLARATRATLTGTVYDSTRAAPLAGAEVFLSGTGYRAVTDAAGRFRIDDLPDGVYAASFLHPRLDSLGIYARPREVTLEAGVVAEVRLAVPSAATLLAAGVALEDAPADPADDAAAAPVARGPRPLAATEAAPPDRLSAVGFYDRERTTTGAFLDRDQIRTRNAGRVSQLLLVIPGVRVRRTDDGRVAVHMRDGERPSPTGETVICWPRVVLDGTVAWRGGVGSPAYLDDVVHPAELEGIEVYRSDAELPAVFSGTQSGCGVIVLWTRDGVGG